MRKTVTSIISAAALLGASSLALAAPGVPGDQTQPNANSQGQLNDNTTSSRTGSSAAPYQNNGGSTSGSTSSHSGTAGSGTSAQVTDQAQVKQQLEQQGYTDVQQVRKQGSGWTAKAKKGSQQVTVNVDSNGQVKTR